MSYAMKTTGICSAALRTPRLRASRCWRTVNGSGTLVAPREDLAVEHTRSVDAHQRVLQLRERAGYVLHPARVDDYAAVRNVRLRPDAVELIFDDVAFRIGQRR